jgi:DsbC/DsbD-like thiol-disulfide interchange protein
MLDRSRTSFVRLDAQIVAIFVLAHLVQPAQAGDESAWASDMHSAVRLIAASAIHDGGHSVLRAGIEIRLDPGWKTYWRYPGDSGVPPRLNFARSQNVQAVTVKYPAPRRFADDGGQSIGYKEHVILPLTIVPKDAGRPVTLRVDVDYAVCEKLCIPAEGKVEVVTAGKQSAHDALLAQAEARVPQRRRLGESSSLSVRAVNRGKPDRIIVDVAARENTNVDLFAEGPSTDWALPLPEPIAGAPAGLKRFAFTLDGLPPGATPQGAMLTLTAVTEDAAIEVEWRLD